MAKETQTTQAAEYEALERQFLSLVEDPGEVMDPRAVQMSIVARILSADDFDSALDMADTGALSLEDIADTPFLIDAITWHRSAEGFREGGLGVFALIAATVLTDAKSPLAGKAVAVTAGGVNVLATLYKGQTQGAIPDLGQDKRRQFVLRPVGTASGYTTYWLARA